MTDSRHRLFIFMALLLFSGCVTPVHDQSAADEKRGPWRDGMGRIVLINDDASTSGESQEDISQLSVCVKQVEQKYLVDLKTTTNSVDSTRTGFWTMSLPKFLISPNEWGDVRFCRESSPWKYEVSCQIGADTMAFSHNVGMAAMVMVSPSTPGKVRVKGVVSIGNVDESQNPKHHVFPFDMECPLDQNVDLTNPTGIQVKSSCSPQAVSDPPRDQAAIPASAPTQSTVDSEKTE